MTPLPDLCIHYSAAAVIGTVVLGMSPKTGRAQFPESITMGRHKGARRVSVVRRISPLRPDHRGVFKGYVIKYFHLPPRSWSPEEVDRHPFRRGGILDGVSKCTWANGG